MAKAIIHTEKLFEVQTRKSRARTNRNEFMNRAIRGRQSDLWEEEGLVRRARDEEREAVVESRRRRFWRRLASLMMLQHRREERQNQESEMEGEEKNHNNNNNDHRQALDDVADSTI